MPDRNNGGEGAITTAFYTVEQSLKSYLMRFLVRKQDIEDTVQETFLRAWEAEKTSEIRSPKSFLFKVAKNLALSEIARKTNRMMVTIGDFDDLEVLVNRSSLEDELEQEKSVTALLGVIGTLPPKCQKVILMRKVYGFSHKEIARRMDISVKTVEKHLTKALQRCQEAAPGGRQPWPESRLGAAPEAGLASLGASRGARGKGAPASLSGS